MKKADSVTTKTNYFAAVKTIQDVHEVVISNLDKLQDDEFIKQFHSVYESHKNNYIGKYGKYTSKNNVTADDFLRSIANLIALQKVRVYENGKRIQDINLTIRYCKERRGVNVGGDTFYAREFLKGMGYRWNPATKEWWHSFKEAPKHVELPKSISIKTSENTPVSDKADSSRQKTDTASCKPVESKKPAEKITSTISADASLIEKVKIFKANQEKVLRLRNQKKRKSA